MTKYSSNDHTWGYLVLLLLIQVVITVLGIWLFNWGLETATGVEVDFWPTMAMVFGVWLIARS